MVNCPIDGCHYATPDMSDAVVAALITAHSVTHTAQPTAPPTHRVESVKRPNISAAGSNEEWSYFTIRWNDYINATGVSGNNAVIQLLECCDDNLRKDLTRSEGGSLMNKSVDYVLRAIKKLAVREENVMVARVNLHNMTQDRDEPVRSFGARLRGQAGVCKFTMNCTSCNADVDYTDTILRDVLIRGLSDQEIQLELLGNSNQNMSLEEVFQFVDIKESGKRSASLLIDNHGANSMSSYKRISHSNIKDKNIEHVNSQDPCSYCGKKGHGKKSPVDIRRTKCPAYGKTCNRCKKLHHFDNVCRGKPKEQTSSNDILSEPMPENSSIFSELCSVTGSHLRNAAIALDHHQYDIISKAWIKTSSDPQPYIRLTISTSNEDYSAFGFSLSTSASSSTFNVTADTGCQSSLAGVKVIKRLNLSLSDLIPVTMKMKAANSGGINILGAAILRFTGRNQRGELVETRQLTYITDNSDKVYLCKEGCVALGLISKTFPQIGEALPISSNVTSSTQCDCLVRQLPPTPPSKLPFAPSEANRERLQTYLLDFYKSSTFNTCEHQTLPMMEGPPMKLMVDPTADPVAHHTPVPVPLHWQEDVKRDLDNDVNLGVIEPVPIGEPVTWCHRMVVCAKKNGKPRRTVDLQALNAHATRETHHTQSPFHQARSIPHGKMKTVLDAWNGYHSVPIRKEDRHLTTFITPWGRYRYRTAPQGYIASGDGYSRRYDELVAHIPRKTKCIDDTLLWSDSIEECFFHTIRWLDTCGRNGITLNPRKFVFAANTVEFAGFEISLNSVRPCEKYFTAIRDFPTPKNITDIRSWFGLVNQVSYAFSTTDKMLPFRDLLKPGLKFKWDETLDQVFHTSKEHIISEICNGVQIFDKTKPTCLATDWSQNGIGFWLSQKHCSCPSSTPFCCRTGWKPTLFGSRFTHAAESRYAPIEGEALAVVHALDKSRFFVLGCTNLTIAVDHKPLLRIFTNRSLEDIPNARLRNLKEKTLRYRFRVIHVPGPKHRAADAASRLPTGTRNPLKLPLIDDLTEVPDQSAHECATLEQSVLLSQAAALDVIQSVTWDRVKVATCSNPDYQELISLIVSGIPTDKDLMPGNLLEFHRFRDDLYTVDGVIIYKGRIVVPPSLRMETLNSLHAAHQGVTSMIARAENSIFWPGITQDITEIRKKCVIATALPHLSQPTHHNLYVPLCTHSSTYALTSSITWGKTTLWSSTDTQIGRSLSVHRMAQKGLSHAFAASSSLTVLQKN